MSNILSFCSGCYEITDALSSGKLFLLTAARSECVFLCSRLVLRWYRSNSLVTRTLETNKRENSSSQFLLSKKQSTTLCNCVSNRKESSLHDFCPGEPCRDNCVSPPDIWTKPRRFFSPVCKGIILKQSKTTVQTKMKLHGCIKIATAGVPKSHKGSKYRQSDL